MSRKKKNFPIRIPRYATGIRAQNLRATGTWWEKRWLAAIMGKDLAGRFGRGKNYALSGQVVSLVLSGPHVAAQVVGTRAQSYDVTVDFRTPAIAARRRIVAALKAEPMLVARLLANDLPTEIEQIFKREGCELFPGGKLKATGDGEPRYDMTTRCNCPDYANPCKHAHAVLLLLGEEVVRRPGTLLELRGITMEELYES